MKISVIIPSFNQGAWIRETLDSVLEQNWNNIEIIVIDGGSNDNTLEVLTRYKKHLSYYHSKPDKGQADAVNQGIAKASGDIICWLNSDDLLCKDAFAVVAEALSIDCDAVYGSWLWANSDLTRFSIDRAPRDIKVEDFSAGHCLLNQPSIFTKRSTWDKVGPLNENLHYALDYEWLVRFFLKGLKCAEVKRPLAINRVHASMKSMDDKLRQEKIQVAKEIFGTDFSSANTILELFGSSVFRRYPITHLLGLAYKKAFSKYTTRPGIPIPAVYAQTFLSSKSS